MRLSLTLGSALLVAISAAAHADTFTFSATATNGFTASGTLTGTVDPYNANAFDITSASVTIDSQPAELYTPSGNTETSYTLTFGSNTLSYDNVVYTSGSALDFDGLLLTNGSSVWNLFWSSTENEFQFLDNSIVASRCDQALDATFSLTPTSVTPEPSSLLLLGTGFAGAAIFLRRRNTLALQATRR
jgi:hypothetical protein